MDVLGDVRERVPEVVRGIVIVHAQLAVQGVRIVVIQDVQWPVRDNVIPVVEVIVTSDVPQEGVPLLVVVDVEVTVIVHVHI